MGRVLEVLRKAGPSGADVVTAASILSSGRMPARDPDEPVAEEIPYIEVGGPGVVTAASASVLKAGPPLNARRSPFFPSRAGSAGPAGEPASGPAVLAFEEPPARLGVRCLSPDLIAFHDPEHPLAEIYASLWERISRAVNRPGSRAILFLGLGSVPWKTTVVLNLALTCARQDSVRVAVVESGAVTSAVGQHFGLPEGPGLAEVLRNEIPLEAALQDTLSCRVRILRCGQSSQATSARGVQSVLKHLRSEFDCVFVDGPGRAGQPGDSELALATDAVCAIVRRSEARLAEVEGCLQGLAAHGARVIGSVVTDP